MVKKQGKFISDQIQKTPKEVVAEGRMSKGTQKTMKDYNKKITEQEDVVDDHVADFLYENCLTQYCQFKELGDSIGIYRAVWF